MMNDSVREELQTKIGTGPAPQRADGPPPASPVSENTPAAPNPKPARTITTELNRQKTSPTLVEFQTKNATLPEWRLQLQNAVRHRKVSGSNENGQAGADVTAYQAQLVTSGANALKAEFVEETAPKPQIEHEDPRVVNALKRIDRSLKTFLPEASPAKPAPAKIPEARNYPFNVVSRNAAQPVRAPEVKASVNVPPKPRLVPTVTPRKTGYDTNKLPPISAEEQISSLDMPVSLPIPKPAKNEVFESKVGEAPQFIEEAIETEIELAESDEIDDLAPFATRFNAGLFDLIIGLFASLIILSPIAFVGGNWMSGAGLLTLVGTCSIVMFVYLTLSLALFGRTAGMKLFSLELVDADLNEYPSFRQAAVSSAVYLLTLPLGGLGFLTMFFNDEKRAAHDLFSGTIIVTQF